MRIVQDPEAPKPSKNRRNEDADVPDPLDSTRIHPEDYELARKMATDALDLDEEDIHDEHPSYAVGLMIQDEENAKKLDELNLDDFAVSMYESSQDKKRHTLNLIRAELIKPYGELRRTFQLPDKWDVVTMLTGETSKTLRVGMIVSVQVLRVNRTFASVRLDSGIDGVINGAYLADGGGGADAAVYVTKGATIAGVIIDVKLNPESDSFVVELSSRSSDVATGDSQFRRVKNDPAWNHAQCDRDAENPSEEEASRGR